MYCNVITGVDGHQGGRAAAALAGALSRRSEIARLLAGDDVRSVLHASTCAIAVAPGSYATGPRAIRRIGVAFDGSPEGDAPAWGVPAVIVDDPAAELAAAREQVKADGLEVQHVYGRVGQELVEFSRGLDLLVCGSRRSGVLRRVAAGSTSEYLARHLSIPLFISPPVDAPALGRWRAGQQAVTGSAT